MNLDELEKIYSDIFQSISDIENTLPTSSDELYEQTKLLSQYQKMLSDIEWEIGFLQTNQMLAEIDEAINKSPEEFFKVISKQLPYFE